ncbi:MAG: hypothetical protein E3J86_08310 [Candidatus Thorarchaeota archaeon]|nr:MAG: hypothetical protein E3J86_08310 [Candidatus Thorarchaeota archaeon]
MMRNMSLRDRIPDQLKISEDIIAITMEDDVSVYPTSDYVLVEISHKAGRINIPKISGTLRGLVKDDKRYVAIRGFGFKGVGLAVRVAHELKIRESKFTYLMTFDTFDATDPETNRPVTSVQIIVMPPE